MRARVVGPLIFSTHCQRAKFPASVTPMRNYLRCVSVMLCLNLLSIGCANPSYAPEPKGQEPVVAESDRSSTLPFIASNVVIVIDHSALALLASGIDVDGNGIVGRDRIQADWISRVPTAPQFWTTDSGDTVRALQLRVARTLVERLVLRQNRVGLASFAVRSRYKVDVLPLLTDVSQVLVPVGATGAVLAALDHFPPAHAQKRTDLSRLLEQAALLLDEAVTYFEPVRPRMLLLLYLGQPSAPDGKYWSSQRALERAAELGKRGIAVWGIPIGPGKFDFLDELTRRSGGGVIPLDQLDARFAPIVPGKSGANVHDIRG